MNSSWPSYQPIYLAFVTTESLNHFGDSFGWYIDMFQVPCWVAATALPASKKKGSDAAPGCLVKWHWCGGPSYGLSARCQRWRRTGRTGRPCTEAVSGRGGESKEEPGADVPGFSWNHFAGAVVLPWGDLERQTHFVLLDSAKVNNKGLLRSYLSCFFLNSFGMIWCEFSDFQPSKHL